MSWAQHAIMDEDLRWGDGEEREGSFQVQSVYVAMRREVMLSGIADNTDATESLQGMSRGEREFICHYWQMYRPGHPGAHVVDLKKYRRERR